MKMLKEAWENAWLDAFNEYIGEEESHGGFFDSFFGFDDAEDVESVEPEGSEFCISDFSKSSNSPEKAKGAVKSATTNKNLNLRIITTAPSFPRPP